MNAIKVLLRNRSQNVLTTRYYATTKKKIPDPDAEESLPSNKPYLLRNYSYNAVMFVLKIP